MTEVYADRTKAEQAVMSAPPVSALRTYNEIRSGKSKELRYRLGLQVQTLDLDGKPSRTRLTCIRHSTHVEKARQPLHMESPRQQAGVHGVGWQPSLSECLNLSPTCTHNRWQPTPRC